MSFNNPIIVEFPESSKEGIPVIGLSNSADSVTITGTTTQPININGHYLSGDIRFNNNNTTLYGGYGSSTNIFQLYECSIINEPFPKGDTLNLTCNEGGSATFEYQFADIIII